MNTKTGEWQKNQDYKEIRERRKMIRKQIDAKMRVVRRLYVPAILGVIFGIIFLFGAIIRSLGEGTVFWNFREQFKIIGPIVIVLGILLLLTAVGLESHTMEKFKKAGVYDVKPVIHPDFLNESKNFNRQTSKDSSGSSYEPNCSGLERQRLLWTKSNQDEEDGFLCSSIASASSGMIQKGKNNLAPQRSRTILMNVNDRADTVQASVDNAIGDHMFEAMYNIPGIEVTDFEEISCHSISSYAQGSNSVSVSSSNSVSVASSLASLPRQEPEVELSLTKNNSVSKDIAKLREITEETTSQIEEHG